MRIRILMVCVFCLIGLQQAWADGDSRAAKPEEIAFQQKALNVLEKVIPEAPKGWTVGEKTDPKKISDRVAPEAEKFPMRVSYSIDWENQPALASADQKTQQALEELAKKQLDLQAKSSGSVKKMEEIIKRFGQAMEKGDMAAAQKIQTEELDPLQKELEQNGKDADAEIRQKTDPLKARDARVQVLIEVNASYQELGEFQKTSGIGEAMVFRREDKDFQSHEGQTVALLGSWKPDTENQPENLIADFNPKVGYLNAQTLLVRVSGAETRCREILEKLDWATLKGFMSNDK